MRGTLGTFAGPEQNRGIIPAYAGNTRVSHATRKLVRDHPRVCGEHYQFTRHSLIAVGSSPRMRGTRIVFDWTVYDPGIIPAYAGNTKMSGLVT